MIEYKCELFTVPRENPDKPEKVHTSASPTWTVLFVLPASSPIGSGSWSITILFAPTEFYESEIDEEYEPLVTRFKIEML